MIKGAVLTAVAVAFSCWSATAHAAEPVRIGAPLALTGALASSGKKQAVGYQVWLDKVNAAGGIDVGGEMRPVELVTYDYQSDAQKAGQLSEKLIVDDEVDFMVAPFGSGHSKIAAGVAERYGVPIVAVASSEPVHDQGFKYLFGMLAPSASLVDSLLNKVTAEAPEVKTIAVLGREDIFPRSMADLMVARAPEHGIEVVYNGIYPIDAVDHSAALTSMRSDEPDWIYVTGYSQDLIMARKQMADLGIDAPIVTMITGPVYREFTDALGPLAEGVTSATWWHWATAYESDDVFGSTQAFYDAIVEKTGGEEPDYVHASSAGALVVLQKAIEAAGSTERDTVRQALADMDIVTFFGPIQFREDGMNTAEELPLIQIQGGDPVIIYPEDIKQADLAIGEN